MKFSDLDIHPSFRQALAARGFDEATPVQEAVLTADARDRDLLVSSRTGSGKTVAFGLAIGGALLEGIESSEGERPLALVVAPTRELALQVQRELQWLFGPAGGRVASCVGGMDFRREQRALQDGAHLVVGTPGRLCDHLERGTLDLSGLGSVVLDEADEMLDMGFRDELERILQDAPTERRTLLFSATLPREIDELARRYQRDAHRIAATSPEVAHQDIEYRAHLVAAREIELAVVNLLRFHDAPRALVFCATREGVARLSASLTERGFEAVALSGELSQAERTRALKALRDGRAKVLVATDVAARGLDLPEVSLVIHADLPIDAQVMQHRSGRTGRAGRKGVSVVLSPVGKRRSAERLLKLSKVRPHFTPLPSLEEIRALDQERLLQDLLGSGHDPAPDDREVAKRLLAERPAEELVAGLVKEHRARRPAPEELPLTAAALEREAADPKAKGSRATAPKAWASERAGTPFGVQRPARGRPSFGDGAGGAWFRMNVGRAANADPRWLVPIICRRGGISNREIGRIQILDRESRFQIAPHAVEAFEAAAGRPDEKDPSIRIERLRVSEAPGGIPSFERPPRVAPSARPAAKRSVRRSDTSPRGPEAEGGERPFRPARGPFAKGGDRPFRPARKPFAADDDRPFRPARQPFAEGGDRRFPERARPFSPSPSRLGDNDGRRPPRRKPKAPAGKGTRR
ncbi:MAG TPA: DEAD/DEAH box helicase [Vulgatibacter sp.]|nr:DEAD/DEAH box helicase [Vulgatibacter sp.]